MSKGISWNPSGRRQSRKVCRFCGRTLYPADDCCATTGPVKPSELIPVPNLTTSDISEAYPRDSIIPPVEYSSIDVSNIIRARDDKGRCGALPWRQSRWIEDKMRETVLAVSSSSTKRSKLFARFCPKPDDTLTRIRIGGFAITCPLLYDFMSSHLISTPFPPPNSPRSSPEFLHHFSTAVSNVSLSPVGRNISSPTKPGPNSSRGSVWFTCLSTIGPSRLAA